MAKQASLLILSLVAGLLSQSLVIPVMSAASLEGDRKNYYHSPDPHAGATPPRPRGTLFSPHVVVHHILLHHLELGKPTLIWGLFGFWGATLGGAFGLTSSGIPGIGSHLSLEQALSNTRTDGYGALYREGTASLLNSMVSKRFPFTTEQVRDNFISSLSSNNAAAAQAHDFKLANEA